MQASAFLAFHGLSGNQVTDVNHVAKLTKFTGCLTTLEEAFGFFIQDVQSVPGTDEADIATDNTYVCFHNLVHFLHALGDKYQFFRIHGTFGIPFRDVFVTFIAVHHAQGVLGCSVGIYHGFNQGVGCQSVASMKAGT